MSSTVHTRAASLHSCLPHQSLRPTSSDLPKHRRTRRLGTGPTSGGSRERCVERGSNRCRERDPQRSNAGGTWVRVAAVGNAHPCCKTGRTCGTRHLTLNLFFFQTGCFWHVFTHPPCRFAYFIRLMLISRTFWATWVRHLNI